MVEGCLFKENPTRIINEMFDSEELITVNRADGRDFVIIPLNEWESWKENLRLMGSKKNAETLRKSIQEIESGNVEVIDIQVTKWMQYKVRGKGSRNEKNNIRNQGITGRRL